MTLQKMVADDTKPSGRKVKFDLNHRDKKNGDFDKLNTREEKTFQNKLRYFEEFNIAEFQESTAQPKPWDLKPPGKRPKKLSEDLRLYYMRFTPKMRVFAYRETAPREHEFFVVWVTAKHEHA